MSPAGIALPVTQTDFTKEDGLVLLTLGTPNGVKVSIALEELKAIGAIPGYKFKSVNFKTNEQKEPWFLAINPNGRIPALVDNRADKGPINVWESASILFYLARVYDTKFAFHFEDADLEQEMTNWIFFIQGGLGPMQGQSNHFFRYAPEKIPYGINRYQEETKRLFSTYDHHLSTGREFLVGEGKGKYSYADICTFPWVRIHDWSGVSIEPFPHLAAWMERIAAREGVKAGLDIPEVDTHAAMKADPSLAAKKAAEAAQWIMDGLAKEKAALAAKFANK
jgi:glutathione S-transferase